MASLTRELSIAHVVADLHPKSGGPSRTVPNLVDAQCKLGLEVTLICQRMTGAPSILPVEHRVHTRIGTSTSTMILKSGLPAFSQLQNHCRKHPPEIIHSHGLWLPVNHWTVSCARRFNIPLVIHPRGMLEPWALRQHAWKKRLAMRLFQAADLARAGVLIATSDLEYESIRAAGCKQPVAVIPNGVDLYHEHPSPPYGSRSNTVLFLSRLHPKKGLLDLIQAWARLKPKNWKLCIAGPDEGGHLQQVRNMVRIHDLEASVDFVGEANNQEKFRLFNDARLFILPTHSENFGLVVVEALAHGLPVITTHQAPWADLDTHGCGWWVRSGAESLEITLRTAMALDGATWQRMSDSARVYVRRYGWETIARNMTDVYRWLLSQGERPEYVRVD